MSLHFNAHLKYLVFCMNAISRCSINLIIFFASWIVYRKPACLEIELQSQFLLLYYIFYSKLFEYCLEISSHLFRQCTKLSKSIIELYNIWIFWCVLLWFTFGVIVWICVQEGYIYVPLFFFRLQLFTLVFTYWQHIIKIECKCTSHGSNIWIRYIDICIRQLWQTFVSSNLDKTFHSSYTIM